MMMFCYNNLSIVPFLKDFHVKYLTAMCVINWPCLFKEQIVLFVVVDRVFPVAFCINSVGSNIYLISQCKSVLLYFVTSMF